MSKVQSLEEELPPIKTLPVEIFEQYVFKLPIEDILKLCQVDREFWKICQDDQFWYRLYLSKYPENSQDIIVDSKHAINFPTWKEQMIKTSDPGFSLYGMMRIYWILSEPIPENLPHIWIKGPIELNFQFFSDIIPGTVIIDKPIITTKEIVKAIADFYHQNKTLFGPYNIYYREIIKIPTNIGKIKRYIVSTGY